MVLRKGYMFSSKKHSVRGFISAILGVLSAAILGVVLYVSFLQKGNAGLIIGVIGLLSILITIIGLIIGIRSFFEEDKYYLTSKIGTTINTVILICWFYIIIIGS